MVPIRSCVTPEGVTHSLRMKLCPGEKTLETSCKYHDKSKIKILKKFPSVQLLPKIMHAKGPTQIHGIGPS
jgi:hypothetical protein